MLQGKRGSFFAFISALAVLIFLILVEINLFDGHVAFDMHKFRWSLIVLFCTIIIAKIVSQILHRYFADATVNLRVADRTRYALFAKLSSVLIWVVGIGIIIGMVPQLRAASISIFAGAGVLAIIIGFATQKTFGNLASGVFIATFQPFRIGDRLKIMDELGVVRDISLRHTIIETWDNRRLIIPNSRLDDEIINNFSIEDERMLGTLEISISYDSDIDTARSIMIEETMLHEDFLDVRAHKDFLSRDEPVKVRVVEAGDSGMRLRLYYWARDQPTCFKMHCDLLESIKKRFDREGIEIPFPYRTIVYKKDIERQEHQRRHKAKTLRQQAERAAEATLLPRPHHQKSRIRKVGSGAVAR